jgi:hypothetical protein
MHFRAEHTFPAEPARVAALMVDPDFEGSVALPDLSPPTVLEHDTSGTEHVLRLRYEYVGQLDPIARRLLGNRSLTLIQTVTLDPATGTGTLTLEAEADPRRLHGRAGITLTEHGGSTTRTLEGDFTVKVPVIGGTAERKLLPGVLSRFDVEAAALTARLRADEAGR